MLFYNLYFTLKKNLYFNRNVIHSSNLLQDKIRSSTSHKKILNWKVKDGYFYGYKSTKCHLNSEVIEGHKRSLLCIKPSDLSSY